MDSGKLQIMFPMLLPPWQSVQLSCPMPSTDTIMVSFGQACADDCLATFFRGYTHPGLPQSFKQLITMLEKRKGHDYYAYDACPGPDPKKPCGFLYRCEYRDVEQCPLCDTSRWRKGTTNKPALQMLYQPLRSYINFLYSDADLARY